MKKAHGLRRYFYEYVYYKAVEQAREQTGQVIPISQAKAIRARVDEILGQRGTALADPRLGVTDCLTAIDQVFAEKVSDYEPQFGDHSPQNERYQQSQREFTRATGVGVQADPKSARLPISPYDPDWSERATVKRAGTAVSTAENCGAFNNCQGQSDLPAISDVTSYNGPVTGWGKA